MNARRAFRSWLIAGAATVIATLLCIAYLDRPLAELFELHLRHTPVWNGLYVALLPLGLVPLAAVIYLFACGAWILSGRLLPRSTIAPLLCSWATVWAIAATVILKRTFGRGWPDPEYVRDHLYGFHLLHGGAHWESFPSGTAAISCAIVSVLWILMPRRRTVCVLIVALLCAAVVVANFHWLSDVLAGAFLGSTVGWMTTQLHAATHPPD